MQPWNKGSHEFIIDFLSIGVHRTKLFCGAIQICYIPVLNIGTNY